MTTHRIGQPNAAVRAVQPDAAGEDRGDAHLTGRNSERGIFSNSSGYCRFQAAPHDYLMTVAAVDSP
jgi:hypothetical protein